MADLNAPQKSRSGELGFEEIVDRLIPADPRISPDGTMVLLSVGARSKRDDKTFRALWLSRNGDEATRFTGGEWNDHDAAWAPDGRRIAFLSNRRDTEGEKDSLFLIDVSGGEAQRLGELEGNLSGPGWSPHGNTIAVLRTDPETDDEKQRKEAKDDPITVEVNVKPRRLWLVNATTGVARCLTFGKRTVWEYDWSADGASIVYTTTDLNTFNATCGTGSIWTIPVAGGAPHHVADATPLPGSPVVRERKGEPVIVVRGSRLWDDPADAIWTVPFAGGKLTNILPGYKGSVQEIRPDPTSPDGIIVRIVEGTHARAYTLKTSGKRLKPLDLGDGIRVGADKGKGKGKGKDKETAGQPTEGTIYGGPTMSDDGKRLAFVWTASDRPEEVFLTGPRGKTSRITSFGKDFEDRLAPGEIVSWTSGDGTAIEGILVVPRNDQRDEPLPLIVQVHGGPSWQWEDRANLNWHDWAQMLASRGYATLLPNPRGSTGYGADFERLLQDDVGGGECRDLVSGAQAMVDQGIADPDRLAIAGWSWGGYLTAWTITQTDIFRAAIMGAGLANLLSDHAAGDIPDANNAYYSGPPYTHWDLYAERSPLRHVVNVKTPTLILHGDSDQRVSPTQGLEYFRALQNRNVPVEFVRYPREGHGINERPHQLDLMRRIIEWLGQYL